MIFMPDQSDPKTPLLQPAETAIVPAATTPVVIRDLFTKNRKARFATIYGEFKGRFFDKTEKPAPEVTYRKYKLLRISPDGPIIAELGGVKKVEGTFSAAFALIQQQGNGEAGFLQTNGYANIFYARDQKGELCAIRIGWAESGWVIDAISVEDPLAWNGKHEIFCPIPAPLPAA
jgi:hypothetical protein